MPVIILMSGVPDVYKRQVEAFLGNLTGFDRLDDCGYLYFKIGAAQHIVSCLYRPDGNLRIPGELPYSFHDQIIGNDHAVKP